MALRVNQRASSECLLLAHSGHKVMHRTCPLLDVKRTSPSAMHRSAFDPKRTLREKTFTSDPLSDMPLGERTFDPSFYNHLSEMRASSDGKYA